MMTSFISHSRLLTYLLIGVTVAVLLLVAVVIFLLVKGRGKDEDQQEQEKQEKAETDGKKEPWGRRKRTPGLAQNFREAMSRLRDRLSNWKARYNVPWYALVGEIGSGKTTIADTLQGASSGMTHVEGDAAYSPQWLLLDKAVLIDIPGAAFLNGSTAGVPFGGYAEHSDQSAWRNFLRLCTKYRPREPLNGIVLTISAEELLAAVPEPEHPERTARLVEMARRLDDIQHFTGLKLPVYVLVTKCDLIGGFQSYSQIFRERAQTPAADGDTDGIEDSLFGWSNPYLLDTSYSSSWVDDAFDTTNDVLLRYQLEMLASSRSTAESDHVMMFPFALQELREPLRALMDRIFRNTAYHGPHTLRGIYFCGRQGESPLEDTDKPMLTTAGGPLALLNSRPDRVIYIRHLFEFKVFAERFLAKPLAGGYFTRNRSVIAAQIAASVLAVVLTASTFAAWFRLSDLVHHHVEPTLRTLSAELDQIAVEPGTNMTPAMDVLSSVGGARLSELYSPALPYSYVDLQGLHRRLNGVIQSSFNIVVLNSCHAALENRIYALLSAKVPVVTGNYATLTYSPGSAWTLDPAYINLEQYLKSIQALETNIQRYRFVSSAGSGTMEQLNYLLEYLGAPKMPSNSRIVQDASYRRYLLHSIWSPLTMPRQFNQQLATAVNLRVQNFFVSWFGTQVSPLAQEVAWLRGTNGLPLLLSVDSNPTDEQLRALVNHIQAMNSQLADGSYDWLTTGFQRESYPALGPEMDRMPFASAEYTAQIGTDGASALSQLQTAVLSGSPQVVSASDGKVRLADDVRTLGSVLDALLNYEVMNEASGGVAGSESCQEIPAGYIWNQNDLQNAVALYKMRQKIDAELIPEVSGNYRQAVRRLVDERAAANIALMIDGATAPNVGATDSQAAFTSELQNFSRSLSLLQQVSDDLGSLNDTDAQSCLQQSMTQQAQRLLAGLNRRLPSMFLPPVRAPRGNLSMPVSLALYGFSSTDDLQQYLATEQQQVETYAAEAGPLVDLLKQNGSQSGLLKRWEDISQDVTALNSKEGVNPIQDLETYISNDLNEVTPERDCKTLTPGNSSDVFLNVRGQLAAMAVSECHNIAVERFNKIAIAFNNKIGGQFPFSKTLDTRPEAEASVADIAKFYQTLDEYGGGLSTVLPSLVENPEAVTGFLNAVQLARPLVTGTPKVKTPSVMVDLKFRSNRSHEVYGNRIALWTVKIGSKSESYPPQPSASAGLAWSLDDPVSVTLRYAFNSPQIPAGSSESSAAQVNGNAVTFQYSDPWALLAMLRDHAAGPGSGPHQYAFVILNENKQGQGSSPHPSDTQVYLDVKLLPVGAKPGATPLAIPAFPYKAPYAEMQPVNGD